MSLTVTVALIADPVRPLERTASQEEWSRPYGERRKVQVEGAETDTLATILERAAATLGLTPPSGRFSAWGNRIAFYKTEDEKGLAERAQPRLLLTELIVVDRHGRALFGVSDLRTVRYDQLLRSAEAGTIEGDPLRPYLVAEPGWGDMPPVDWPTAYEGLKVVWEAVEIVATVGGAVGFVALVLDRVRKRVNAGREAIDAHYTNWTQRSQRPDQFVSLMTMRPWTPEELARLLDCSSSEAEAVLWCLGFAYDEADGRWRPGGDEAARAIRGALEELDLAWHALYDEWEPTFRRRLVRYLETGERPPLSELYEAASELEESEPEPAGTSLREVAEVIRWSAGDWLRTRRSRP